MTKFNTWWHNKKINPETKRKIKKGGKVFKNLLSECLINNHIQDNYSEFRNRKKDPLLFLKLPTIPNKPIFEYKFCWEPLTGEIIGLSLSDSQQQWSIISRDGNKKIIKKNTFNWGQLQSFTKTIETSSGSRVLLDNEMSLEPVIIFYPSGENTGAKLYFETIDKKLEIIISKN